MGAKKKIAALSTSEVQKKTKEQEEHLKKCRSLMRDRVEDAKDEFLEKLRKFRSPFTKQGRRRPRFRIRAKMSGKDALKLALRFKLRELEALENKFVKGADCFCLEAAKTVKDSIETYKQEESMLRANASDGVADAPAGKAQELQRREASLKRVNDEIMRLRQSSTKPAKSSRISTATPTSTLAKRPHAPEVKRSSFNGIWEAVCDGSTFIVNLDASGGIISSDGGYSERFKVVGNGTTNNAYSIKLGVEKWEFSNMPAPDQLHWIGKTSGLVSRWTRTTERSKGKMARTVTHSVPRSKAKPMAKVPPSKQATAPPEGRGVTPMSPASVPRQLAPQMPTPENRKNFVLDDDKSPDLTNLPAIQTPPFDQSELLSDISEFIEPPRRVTLSDPLMFGAPASPAPSLDLEPSKTHLEELIDSEAYADMEPFTKQGFAEAAF